MLMVWCKPSRSRDGKHYAYVVTGGDIERREVTIGEERAPVHVIDGLDERDLGRLDARASERRRSRPRRRRNRNEQ